LSDDRIGFIGIGNMGEALLRGIINSNLVSPQSIYASDVNTEKLGMLSEELKINPMNSNQNLIDNSDIILIALKPDVVKNVLTQVSKGFCQPKWCISIAAGIDTSLIESILPDGIPVVRVMPNTPAMVREGMAAICPGKYANTEHINKTKQLFQAVGKAVIVQEKLMDAVTALSGSGPAFVFVLIEALADAGVQLGLSRTDASLMAAQTVLGSSKMLLETQEHPAVLKNRVTSPGGTTAAGLFELERNGFRAGIIEAVVAAAERSKQLSPQPK
jgi:pyrroline-5-carboxylate reductase